jgi:HD-like signal output (HDOD) protein
VDVIVSDLSMPGMNGLKLLHEVRDRHPHVARFVLSGHADMEEAVEAASVAHQFLAKPCDAVKLRQAIARVIASLASVTHAGARVRAAWVKSLPPMPRTFGAITYAIQDVRTSARDIAALVETDVGLTAKVLQLVNGAFFGYGQRVSSVDKAVMRLGTNVLRAIVLSQELFRACPARGDAAALERLQERALRVATIARRIADHRAEGDTAFTAALLRDAGRLVMSSVDMGPGASDDGGEVDYAAVGACLLALWGLPDDVVDAVRWHGRPAAAPAASRRIAALVHVADALEREVAGDAAAAPLDAALLDEMGMTDDVAGWRELAVTAV